MVQYRDYFGLFTEKRNWTKVGKKELKEPHYTWANKGP